MDFASTSSIGGRRIAMQKCSRCGLDLPDDAFESPTSICLGCYSTIPANSGLSLSQLREKARKSRLANRKTRKVRMEEALEKLGIVARRPGVVRSGKGKNVDLKEVIEQAKQHEAEWFNCAMCGDDICDGDFGVGAAFKMKDEHGKEIIKCARCVSKYTPSKA